MTLPRKHLVNNSVPFHLILIYGTISIHIVHSEGPFQLFFRCPIRGNMKCEHELSEIYGPTSVRVKSSEHVITEFLCIATWEDLDIHFHKLSLGQLPVWTVL